MRDGSYTGPCGSESLLGVGGVGAWVPPGSWPPDDWEVGHRAVTEYIVIVRSPGVCGKWAHPGSPVLTAEGTRTLPSV